MLLFPPRKPGLELITGAGQWSTTGSNGACEPISIVFTKFGSGVGGD